MGTKVGIVYASGSKILRRIIVPTDDRELTDPAHVQPGETMLVVPSSQAVGADYPQQLVKAATGVPPPSPRCAVVSSAGMVINVVMADPALDAAPAAGLSLIASDVAMPGWAWNAASGFQAPPVIAAVSSAGIVP